MAQSPLTGVLVVVGVLALATAFGWWRRRRDGRLRVVAGTGPAAADETSAVLAAVGVRPGGVTLVQFSSAVCAPCRATRRILDDVTRDVDGVRLLEVDAEHHLDAVRALDVWRTPTVLVVDADGRVVRRASGVPVRAELVATIRPLLAGAAR
ncbi:TlpA family protein disulfide reductase [Micromonospora krabiensis]|uniref:TlpA family protein disulfide reductase n=1 Tax=Micromonospora krabiensis TaxID=307121 RepID=UPI001E52325D|nr:thioredoxin family protein [Micromonospora krabiensis]